MAGSPLAEPSPIAGRPRYAASAPARVASSAEHVADPVMADRQIAVPAAIGCIAGCQFFGDRQIFAIRRQRTGKIALRHQDIADFLMADRQIALPVVISCVARRQLLGDGMTFSVIIQSSSEVALQSDDTTPKRS